MVMRRRLKWALCAFEQPGSPDSDYAVSNSSPRAGTLPTIGTAVPARRLDLRSTLEFHRPIAPAIPHKGR
jgi:hypothetical protein